jgi:GrpB-like predicted nucleotidyltransferase (UPF0157 family)
VTPFLREELADVGAARTRLAELSAVERKASETDDRLTLAHTLGALGDLRRALGEADEAVAVLERAVEIPTGDALLQRANRLRLANARFYAGSHAVAERELRDLLREIEQSGNPRYLDFAWQHLGKCLAELERWFEAVACFETALRLRAASEDALRTSSETALRVARDELVAHARAPVEEREVTLAEHDPAWSTHFARESARVASAFPARRSAIAVEHIGSTAVPGLLAKPIVDILLGSAEDPAPATGELAAMEQRGYTFLGEDGRRPGRWLWRKRGVQSFNVSLVRHGSDLWNDNLMLRDYLRTHPDEAERYAAVKREAQRASPDSLLGYGNGKRDFLEELKTRARRWQHASRRFG